MNDTAVPLPEPTETVDQLLTLDQRRRVEALQVSRRILENKPGLFAGSKVEANRAVYDLTYLADWIIDGPDNDDTVDVLTGSGERVASISTRPGQWADTGSHGPDGGFPTASDLLADHELRAARSDADDGN